MESKKKSRFERKCDKINAKKYEITKEVMSLVCNKKSNLSDKKLKKVLTKYAKNIIKLEKKKYNIHKLVVINEIKSKTVRGSMSYHKNEVHLSTDKRKRFFPLPVLSLNLDEVVNGLRSDDKQERVSSFITYIATNHHEMTHLEQHIATENVKKIDDINNEDALKYAREFAAIRFLGREYYQEGDNYRKQYIERNAREKGFMSAIDIFGKNISKNSRINQYIKEGLDDVLNDAYVETEELEYNGHSTDRDVITSALVDEAVRTNPAFLKKLPILNKEYNKDGSRKELYQLIKENAIAIFKIKANPFYSKETKEKKLKENRDMYGEIYISQINNSDKKDFIKAEKMVGAKAVEAMLKQTKRHLVEKQEEMLENAKEEKEMRQALGEDLTDIEIKYQERLDAIKDKYKSDIDILEEPIKFFSNGGHKEKEMSFFEKRKQERVDNIKIEANYKAKKIKGNNGNIEYKAVAEEFDLDEMKDLNDEYKTLKQEEEKKLEATKKEYAYVKASKEVNQSEKENKKGKNKDINIK